MDTAKDYREVENVLYSIPRQDIIDAFSEEAYEDEEDDMEDPVAEFLKRYGFEEFSYFRPRMISA